MPESGDPTETPTAGQAICRVVLVDDHTMVREALSQLLEDCGWIEVVGQAGDRSSAVEAVQQAMPDVLLLDYNIPGGGALKVIETLTANRWTKTRILVLTVHESFHYAVRVLEAGADGFAAKSDAGQELIQAIHEVWKGGLYLAPSLAREVLQHLKRPKRARVGLESLSPREFELFRILGEGKGLKEAAAAQHISVSTASTYRSRIMEKLNLSSTAELIRFALTNGVVD